MNKRIKELRFMAAEYANSLKPLGITAWNELRDEKFAELVIVECMYISEKVELEYMANRRKASDFDIKNVYAEGETASRLIRDRIATRFDI